VAGRHAGAARLAFFALHLLVDVGAAAIHRDGIAARKGVLHRHVEDVVVARMLAQGRLLGLADQGAVDDVGKGAMASSLVMPSLGRKCAAAAVGALGTGL